MFNYIKWIKDSQQLIERQRDTGIVDRVELRSLITQVERVIDATVVSHDKRASEGPYVPYPKYALGRVVPSDVIDDILDIVELLKKIARNV